MIGIYFKIAYRNILKDKLFSALNIIGLGVGMAAALLIAQYVRYEYSYDQQSPSAERIWRGYNQTVVDGAIKTEDANTHSAMGPSLKNDLPGVIEDYARIFNRGEASYILIKDQTPLRLEGVWLADPGFLRMFPQQCIAGDLATSLQDPFSIVLSRKAAVQLFTDPVAAVGKTVRIPSDPFNGVFTIKAVVEDPPANVHIKFNGLVSYATRYAQGHQDNWEQYWEYTYFQLAPQADQALVQSKLQEYSTTFLQREGIRLAMQPFTDIHLHSTLTYEIEPNGSARSVQFLSITAALILLIAFVNFVNLTTARATKRGKEVGLRKTVGASRMQLVVQFLLEGAMLNFVALLLALLIVFQAMPLFSDMVDCPLDRTPGFDTVYWFTAATLWAIGVVTACLWPALALSGFSPLAVLKSDFFKRKEKVNFRHGLVIFQFACSTALMIAVMTIMAQLNFLKNHDKGLSLDQVLTVRMPQTDWRLDSINKPKMEVLKREIEQIPGVESVAGSSIVPSIGITTIEGSSNTLHQVANPSASAQATTYFVHIEKGFLETYGIQMAAGQYFDAPSEASEHDHILINEAARKMLGYANAESAIGTQVAFERSQHALKIQGVVSDFHIESLKEPTRPTLYYCQRNVRNGYLSMKIDASQTEAIVAKIRPIWSQVWPESPMDWQFLDAHFDRQYRSEQQLGQVFGLFSGLAMLIACMGLFGLSTFMAERRIKEIGIRKVLGASVTAITGLLAKDFLTLVMVSVGIGIPIAWYFMQHWLMDFAYRIELQWWMFAAAGIAALLIAFLTVSYQSVKAALMDPTRTLNRE